MLESIELVLVTNIFTSFVKSYVTTTVSRYLGVWTEHRVWSFGLVLFTLSTLLFQVPFSSPSKLARYSPKTNKRLGALLSSIAIGLFFVFALVFLILFVSGYVVIGSVRLIMCLTGVLFDVLTISPMGGKGIFDWNKLVWLGLFTATTASYAVYLVFL